MRNPLVVLFLFVLVTLPTVRSARAGEDTDAQAVRERLRTTKVSLDIEAMPLAQVVEQLRVQSGIDLYIDPRIHSDIADLPVTSLHVKDVPLEQVLGLLVKGRADPLLWVPRGEVVLLTSRYLVRPALDTRIYPVAALVAPRRAFVPPPASLLGHGESAETPRADTLPFGGADELLELVRNAVEPSFWEETEGAETRTFGAERIVVTATPAVQDGVLAFLGGLERRDPDAVLVEVHAIDVSAGASDAAAAALLDTTAAGPSVALAVRTGLSSTAFAGTRRAFVAGYEPVFAGGQATMDPQVDTQENGLAVRARVVGGDGEGRILLDLGVAYSEPVSAGSREPSEHGAPDLPRRVLVERESTLLLAPGRWQWAEGRMAGTDAGHVAFLVRATPMDLTAGAPPASTPFRLPAPASPNANAPVEKRVRGLTWDQADLDQVCAYLRTISGLNFFITPRVRAEAYDEIRVTLHLSDASLRTILDLVTEPYELQWRYADGVVTIDSRAEQASPMELRTYDLRDLSVDLAPFTIDETGRRRPTQGRPMSAPLYQEDALAELIREHLGVEDTWDDPATLEIRNHVLIVRNTPEILDAVQGALDALRGAMSVVVTNVDSIEIDADAAPEVLGTTGGRVAPLVLDDGARKRLGAALAAGRARRLAGERVLSVQGSDAPRWSGEEIRYVADYDVETSEAGDAGAAVRRVATLESGTTVSVRALAGAPGSAVPLEIELERSVLKEMTRGSTPHGAIDLPETDVWRVATGLRVPDGATALVLASRNGGRVRLLLVTPRRVHVHD